MAGLLFILAHPDDETFFAGTIAKYVATGTSVGLICATRGERGATADLCSIEELPHVREAELREAARILGISSLEFLPYEDQKLWSAPVDEIRRQLVAIIRRQRPEIIITFDPEGANRHTDHISISHFTTDAVAAAADARWYPETGAPHVPRGVLWTAPLPPFKLGLTKNVAQQPGIDILIDVGPFRETKEAALRAHRTQFPGLSKIFNSAASLRWEAFRVGWGSRPEVVPAQDLFGWQVE